MASLLTILIYRRRLQSILDPQLAFRQWRLKRPCVSQVIREHIASHGGYEINTEGDAFYIAFKQVSSAVLCAMEIQYRLMETEWSRNILKMPGCREASNMHGEPAFKGPRVRMGIHWAVEGTVAHR